MKATKNQLTAIFRTVLLLLLIAFQSCSTYNTQTAEIENDLYNGNFNQAITNIDQNRFLKKDRNHLLYLMEKGKIEHLLGNYEKSNDLLEQAYIMIDDRIKTNAGQAISAKLTNPMAVPYKGEDFEKVTIHYYKALNYFHLGLPNEALVEAKRINIKLYQLNEKYKSNKNKYSEDAFSQILQGILYESTGDINNAFIAYRNAEEIYSRNGGNFFGVPMPEQLKQDLMRTAMSMGFTQEYNDYTKKYGALQQASSKPSGEAIIFWENGLGPAKDQIVLSLAGAGGWYYASYIDYDGPQEIIIPIPVGTNTATVNAIAIPKYRKRDSYYGKASVVVNSNEQYFQLAQDFFPIARQCLKDRMLREVIDIALRFATKKAASEGLASLGKQMFGEDGEDIFRAAGDIAGVATEKADTRNWQSLPATISYTRVPLKEGDNSFTIKKYSPQGVDTDVITIPYKKGLQIINYFDLGRTLVNPAPAPMVASGSVPSNGTATGLLASKPKSAESFQKTDAPASLQSKSYKPVSPDVTLLSIVENYINACGGYERIKGVETLYVKTITKGMVKGTESSIETVSKTNSRNDYSIQTSINGKPSFKMVVNDKEGYTVTDDGSPVKINPETYKKIKSDNTFYQNYITPLSAGDAKIAGITQMDNEDAYVISFTDDAKSVVTNYYSVKSKLLIATSVKAGTTTTVSHFSDYRDVQGIKLPFKNKQTVNGSDSEIITTVIQINTDVYDTDFQ
mgnify:CR=1 FL=1